MLKKTCFSVCVGLLLIGATAWPASAQDAAAEAAPEVDPAVAEAQAAREAAEAAYKAKFGKDELEVRRTRVIADDVEFAQRLVQEGDSGEHDAALTTVIYEKAYEWGMREAKGYPSADKALKKLIETVPEEKFEYGDKLLALWEKWSRLMPDTNELDPEAFIDLAMELSNEAVAQDDLDLALKFLNRGNRFAARNNSARKNDVRDMISDLMDKRKTMEKIAGLEELLASGVDPTAADKLAMLYLSDLDDPEKAATYADTVTDVALAGQLRLAATEFADVTPEQANAMGAFYYALVTDNKAGDSIAMLIRARVWLTEFISRDAGADEQAHAAAVAAANETLGEIDADLLKRGIGRKLMRKLSGELRGEGQFGRPAEIQAAIDKAVAWLYTQRDEERHWEQDQEGHRNWGGYTALVVYALLMADEEPKLNGDLSRSLHFMMNADMKGTYPLCFRVHAWEVLPRRERYRQHLVKDITNLRKAATQGFWGYTLTGNDVKPGTRVDLSTTLAGGLGLWIGEEVGSIAPKKVYWERTARALIDVQHLDGGWSYNPFVTSDGQGAMTAGMLALLHASLPHLGDVTKEKAEEAIEKGTAWMNENFDPTKNVNRGGFKNYYFAAVQHAGIFSGKRSFKEMDWYESIAEHLVKTQGQDGSMGNVSETAFAVAFLCRGGITYEASDSENAEPAEADESSASAEAATAPAE